MTEHEDDEPAPVTEGAIKDKLVEAKKKTAEQGRHLTGETDARRENRLPPGQHKVDKWPVLDLGVTPKVAKEDWRLRVDGLVENPLILSYADLMSAPQMEQVCDIHCVTTWSRFDNRFEGVSTQVILEAAKPLADVRHVIFHAHDGYTTNVTLEAFADADVMLAHSWEGEPLTFEHGGPVRMLMPQWYFWKSAKWVRRIEFTAEDRPGFWEERGYHNRADPWEEERYS